MSVAHAQTVACDETGLLNVAGCGVSDADCVISSEVLCNSSCTDPCFYDLDRDLLVQTTGASDGKFTGADGRSIVFTAPTVKTDSLTAKTRFTANNVIITSNAVYVESDPPEIDLSGKIVVPAGGYVAISDTYNVEVGGITAPGGTVLVDARYQATTTGTIDVSINGPNGGLVEVDGKNVSVNADILARRSGTSGTGTQGRILVQAIGTYNGPVDANRSVISVNGRLAANATSGSRDGGIVVVRNGLGPAYESYAPFIYVTDPLQTDAAGAGRLGGDITVEGWAVVFSGDGSAVASGVGTGNGGLIKVIGHSSGTQPAVKLGPVTSKGGIGGDLEVYSDYNIELAGKVDVRALDAAPRTGGTVKVAPLFGDCGATLTINNDIEASGYGNNGIGGVIDLKFKAIVMDLDTLRTIRASAKPADDLGSGEAGEIYFQAAAGSTSEVLGIIGGQGNFPTGAGPHHEIHAEPNGTIQTSNDVRGGDYVPVHSEVLDDLDCE